MTSVPIKSRAKVLRRFTLGSSWKGVVVLPVANELDEDVDLRRGQNRRRGLHGTRTGRGGGGIVVGGDPAQVGHDAAVVLEVGEAVLDAAVVVVLVEVTEAVLVIEGRTGPALTLAAVTARAVRVVELRALGERVLGVDDEVLVGVGLVKAEAVAVVAHDAADLVDAQLTGRRSRDAVVGGRIQESGQRPWLLNRYRSRRRRSRGRVGRVREGGEPVRPVRMVAHRCRVVAPGLTHLRGMDAGQVVRRRQLLRIGLVLEEVRAQALRRLHRPDGADVGHVARDASLHAVRIPLDRGLWKAWEELLHLDVEVRAGVVLEVLRLDGDVAPGVRVLECSPGDEPEERDAQPDEEDPRPHTGELSPGCPRIRVQSQLKASPRKNSPMTTNATDRQTKTVKSTITTLRSCGRRLELRSRYGVRIMKMITKLGNATPAMIGGKRSSNS